MPGVVRELISRKQGLILFCGPTGSGKSTSMATMIEAMNKTRPCHIITIEDPIEYLHDNTKRCRAPARGRHRHAVVRHGRCGPRCAKTPTSSSSARCATPRASPSR